MEEFLSEKKIALRSRKGNVRVSRGCPLIFQNILLSELAPFQCSVAGVSFRGLTEY